MKTDLFKAKLRGHKIYGWLDTHHTFSFGDYFNVERIRFGALRVVNDDIVAGSEGFDTHPHDDMEIISIPLKGALEHKDNMGNYKVTQPGEVQVMSAGSGITHSEFNANADTELNFLQIWVTPNEISVKPKYNHRKFDLWSNKNRLLQIVSPGPSPKEKEELWIHQNAWFHMGIFDKDQFFDYAMKKDGDGLFVMVIDGEFNVAGQNLSCRDAIGITDIASVSIESKSEAGWILLIEIPMHNYSPNSKMS
jgi:redox-sensitive bicupin YhaK (pirin superfamily)